MATIIPNAGSAGMALGDSLTNAYSAALREGLNQATQANMARNLQLMTWLKAYKDAQLGITDYKGDAQQRKDLDKFVTKLQEWTRVPAGMGVLEAPPVPPTDINATVSGTQNLQQAQPAPDQTQASQQAQPSQAGQPSTQPEQPTQPAYTRPKRNR